MHPPMPWLAVGALLVACAESTPDGAIDPSARTQVAPVPRLALALTAASDRPRFEGQLTLFQDFSADPSWGTFSFFDQAHSREVCLIGTPIAVASRRGAPASCRRRECTNATDLPRGDADAGSLTLTGPMGRSVIPPDGGFYATSTPGRGWLGGERIRFEVAGGAGPDAVPRFAVDTRGVRRAVLDTVVAGRVLDRDRNLRLAWSVERPGADDSTMFVAFTVVVPDDEVGARLTQVECQWDLDDSAGLFPAEALGQLPAGPADFLYATGNAQTATDLGGVALTVGATNLEANWFGAVELR